MKTGMEIITKPLQDGSTNEEQIMVENLRRYLGMGISKGNAIAMVLLGAGYNTAFVNIDGEYWSYHREAPNGESPLTRIEVEQITTITKMIMVMKSIYKPKDSRWI